MPLFQLVSESRDWTPLAEAPSFEDYLHWLLAGGATRLVEEFYGQKAEYVATERTLRLADYTLKSLAQIEMDIRTRVDSGYYFIIETERLLKTSTDVVPAMTLAMRGPCWCLVGLSAPFPLETEVRAPEVYTNITAVKRDFSHYQTCRYEEDYGPACLYSGVMYGQVEGHSGRYPRDSNPPVVPTMAMFTRMLGPEETRAILDV